MKNTKAIAWLVTFGFVSAIGISRPPTWGVKELHIATQAATDKFKADLGAAAFEEIFAFSIEKNSQGIAGKVNISYVDSAGNDATKKLFCHNHGEIIDCH